MEAPHELTQTIHQRNPKSSEPTTQEYTHLQTSPNNNNNSALTVNFSWKNLKVRITNKETPNTPLYIIDAPLTLKAPNLTFRHDTPSSNTTTNNKDDATFGTAKLHTFAIHADCTLHNRSLKLTPLKKLKTSYTHLSLAYSPSPDTPVPMTWTTTCTLKLWEFICLDEHSNAVAKFSARIWATRHLGRIEFLGERAGWKECREEIVVMVGTLYFLMLMRANNPLNLVGAMFAKTGEGKQGV